MAEEPFLGLAPCLLAADDVRGAVLQEVHAAALCSKGVTDKVQRAPTERSSELARAPIRAAAGRANHGRPDALGAAAKLAVHAAVFRVDKWAVEGDGAARKTWVVKVLVDQAFVH